MNDPETEFREFQSAKSMENDSQNALGTENGQISSRILKAVEKDGSIIIERTPIAEIPSGLDAEYDYRIKRARDALAITASFSLYQLEAGSAVAPIVRSEAYREEGLNLEGFCQENFGFSRTRVLEWVVASEMYLWLPPGAPVGASLEPVRALRKILPEKRKDVWGVGWGKRPLRGPRTIDVERIGRKEGWLIPTKPRKEKVTEPKPMAAAGPIATTVQALGTPEAALAAIEELEALILGNLNSDCREAILARHLLHYHERLVSNLTEPKAASPFSRDQEDSTMPEGSVPVLDKTEETLDGRKFRPSTELAEDQNVTHGSLERTDDQPTESFESESELLDPPVDTEVIFPTISVSDCEITCRFRNPPDQNVFRKYGVGFAYLGFNRDSKRDLLFYTHYDAVKLDQKTSELRAALEKALKAMPIEVRTKVTGLLANNICLPRERGVPCPV